MVPARRASAPGGSDQGTGRDARKTAHNPLMLQVPKPAAGSAGVPDLIAEQQKMAEAVGAFALLDVDSAAVRDPRSAAPAYPADMEARGVEGLVKVRFVVDSTGMIDVNTIKVLETTNGVVRARRARGDARNAIPPGNDRRQIREAVVGAGVCVQGAAQTSGADDSACGAGEEAELTDGLLGARGAMDARPFDPCRVRKWDLNPGWRGETGVVKLVWKGRGRMRRCPSSSALCIGSAPLQAGRPVLIRTFPSLHRVLIRRPGLAPQCLRF